LGAFNVYCQRRNVFSAAAEEIGYVLATHAAVACDSVRRGELFRTALAGRDLIGQAKGIIMERVDVDAVRAFDLLNRLPGTPKPGGRSRVHALGGSIRGDVRSGQFAV
jgi:hypothetical protein